MSAHTIRNVIRFPPGGDSYWYPRFPNLPSVKTNQSSILNSRVEISDTIIHSQTNGAY